MVDGTIEPISTTQKQLISSSSHIVTAFCRNEMCIRDRNIRVCSRHVIQQDYTRTIIQVNLCTPIIMSTNRVLSN